MSSLFEKLKSEEVINMGAEARIYQSKYLSYDLIYKHRFAKKYRAPQIDLMLRKERTVQEVRLMQLAREQGVQVPHVLDIDKQEWIIGIEKISGDSVKHYISEEHRAKVEEYFAEIGKNVAGLHMNDIIHGDLTTSNILVDDDQKVWLIDFGLGFISPHVEDKAVDLLVLKHTIESSHSNFIDICMNSFYKGYETAVDNYDQIRKRMDVIEGRVRYKSH